MLLALYVDDFLNQDLDLSKSFRKLDGVRQKVKKNLLKPLQIGLDQEILVFKANVQSGDVDVYKLCLVFLNLDYLDDSILDVEHTHVLREVPAFFVEQRVV
jgi:hypothetical protein